MAQYISAQSHEEIKSFVRENKYVPKYQTMLRFLIGSLQNQQEKSQVFFEAFEGEPRDLGKTYHSMLRLSLMSEFSIYDIP